VISVLNFSVAGIFPGDVFCFRATLPQVEHQQEWDCRVAAGTKNVGGKIARW
jgi:hypothetical protein